MTRSKKTFQSGREVMETYVPGFSLGKEAEGGGDANSLEEHARDVTAEKIVEEFGTRVKKRIEKRQTQSR